DLTLGPVGASAPSRPPATDGRRWRARRRTSDAARPTGPSRRCGPVTSRPSAGAESSARPGGSADAAAAGRPPARSRPDGRRGRASIVGRALEAVFGAIYLDGGLEAARDVALRLVDPEIDRLAESQALKDDKSRLQEAAQGELGLTPSYRTVAAVGPDHAKEFTVEVSLGEVVVGRGIGRTKQIAAQAAAQDALSRWPPGVKSARAR